jgi:hypothetical protein
MPFICELVNLVLLGLPAGRATLDDMIMKRLLK